MSRWVQNTLVTPYRSFDDGAGRTCHLATVQGVPAIVIAIIIFTTIATTIPPSASSSPLLSSSSAASSSSSSWY